MNNKDKIACPACEYERNSCGQPVENNGEMQCLDCGSVWRVFGTVTEGLSKATEPSPAKTRVRALAEQVSFKETLNDDPAPSFMEGFQDNIKSYRPGLGTFMSCFGAVLLFSGVYFGLIFLEKGAATHPMDKLYIAEVEIEEQVRRNGEKVFTVKGLVSNPTQVSKPIPSIAIILRKQNGSEITRWHYNSSLAALRAGGKSRFASSIQYDTPIVAYAEAVFK